MKKLISFLILKLVLSSYHDLVSVEASKSNVVFEVDLIHRDSPLSPHYNSSMTALERLKRRFMGRRESNDVVETDVIPSNGEYLIKIAIGSPAVEFTGIIDTGSDLIWLQCSPCLNCEPQPAPLFDPTKSSTYKAIPCASESCVQSTGCSINDTNQTGSCIYFQGYGDGSNSTGILSTDTITFPSSATAAALPLSVFGCGYDQHGSLFDGEGMIGLGGGPLSLISQLGERINYKFSYCLAPLNISGFGATSKMKFGADLTSPNVVSTPLVINQDPTFYFLQLDGISIGDSLVTVGKDVIIDSGTVLTWLETDIYNGVRDAVTRAIGMSPVPDTSLGMDLCFETDEQSVIGNTPDMVFHFKGADVVLKSPNTVYQYENVTCFTFMPVEVNETMIFGNYAQVNFEVGYDLQAKQVSFVPTDCTNF